MSTQGTTLPPPPGQERAAFEAFCFERGLMSASHGLLSVSSHCDTAWLAWQARAAIAAQAPQPIQFETAEEARKDRQHAEAYYRQAEFLLTSNEKTLHQKIDDLEAQLKAQQAQGVPAGVQARAIDLHGKAGMPWPDAEQLALSEIGADDAAINELIGESGGLEQLLITPDELRQFTRSILVHGSPLLAAAPQAEPQPEPTTWSRYVAGMIACYLQWPDDDERTEAVAGIIERRRWSDRQPELEPMNPDQSASFQWLERLCEPALYLDRLGPLRDYLRTHGIGTKGGGTK